MHIIKMNRSNENKDICRPTLVSYVIHYSILIILIKTKKTSCITYYSKFNQPFIFCFLNEIKSMGQR